VKSSDKLKAYNTIYTNVIHNFHNDGCFDNTENWELLLELTWEVWNDNNCRDLFGMLTDDYDDDETLYIKELQIVKAIDKKCKIALLKKLS